MADALPAHVSPASAQELSQKYNKMGLTYRKNRQLEESLECYDKSIQLDPTNHQAWSNKARVLDELNYLSNAIKCYKKAIELNPTVASTWNNMGYTLRKQQKYTSALQCYKEAIRLQSNHDKFWYNLGYILDKQGKYEEAYECFSTAVTMQPDNEKYLLSKSAAEASWREFQKAFDDPNTTTKTAHSSTIPNQFAPVDDGSSGNQPNLATLNYSRSMCSIDSDFDSEALCSTGNAPFILDVIDIDSTSSRMTKDMSNTALCSNIALVSNLLPESRLQSLDIPITLATNVGLEDDANSTIAVTTRDVVSSTTVNSPESDMNHLRSTLNQTTQAKDILLEPVLDNHRLPNYSKNRSTVLNERSLHGFDQVAASNTGSSIDINDTTESSRIGFSNKLPHVKLPPCDISGASSLILTAEESDGDVSLLETMQLQLSALKTVGEVQRLEMQVEELLSTVKQKRASLQAQEKIANEEKCTVCWERVPEMICIPCGHLCLCQECKSKLRQKRCPICGQPVKNIYKVWK